MIKTTYPLGILGIFIRTSPMSVSMHFMPDADEEEVILREKGTVESEYDNDFDDGED
jgi:hypothetical protein